MSSLASPPTLASLTTLCDSLHLTLQNLHSTETEKTQYITSQTSEILKKLDLFESHGVSKTDLPQLNYLRGSLLSLTSPSLSLQYLTRSIKLHASAPPPYWNLLGSVYEKLNAPEEAIRCYESGIDGKGNPEGLCAMSRLVRGGGSEKWEESESYAKKAIQLDLENPVSWYTLANCYLTRFFSHTFSTHDIRLSLSCYSRSSSLPGGSDNPDLYFNRGTLWKYLEEFERAKDDFERCEVIDQGLEGGRNAREITAWVSRVHEMVLKKGRVKEKKLKAIREGLGACEVPKGEGKTHELVGGGDELEKGGWEEEDKNYDKALALGVLMPLGDIKTPPAKYLCVDAKGGCLVLSIYHLSTDANLSDKDKVIILSPVVKEMKLGDKGYLGVQLLDPKKLVVNGRMADLRKFTPAKVMVETFGVKREEEGK
mmetsp:Transcript_15162/g.28254  ORF Transcript_15162/g.28254 Transcript_15162/m.28254 type:complete len:426 (-) Transcript_15162:92-1369(-)